LSAIPAARCRYCGRVRAGDHRAADRSLCAAITAAKMRWAAAPNADISRQPATLAEYGASCKKQRDSDTKRRIGTPRAAQFRLRPAAPIAGFCSLARPDYHSVHAVRRSSTEPPGYPRRAATTRPGDELTQALPSAKTTAGTVSLPSATERTIAAASAWRQMFAWWIRTRRARSTSRIRMQNGQPGRQYKVACGELLDC
jgi:hypothetical protein